MKVGKYCPVCLNVWNVTFRTENNIADPDLTFCPECERVLLVRVYDYDDNGRWVH